MSGRLTNRLFLSAIALAAALAALLAPAPLGQAQSDPVDSHAGELLVAEPSMADPRFRQSVILLVEHNAQGAFGLMVNRPADEVTWAALLDRLGIDGEAADGRVTLFSGGPVQRRSFFLLHDDLDAGAGSREVGPGIALTGRGEIVQRLARGDGPERWRALLGYAGWGPGQLRSELRRGDWFTVAADPGLVFAEQPERVWQRARDNRAIEL